MNACIITIGNELLNGSTIDTNSVWLGKQLDKLNIVVSEKLTIPDDSLIIEKSIIGISSREFDYIFITGGLGPTHDDITKSVVKKILNSDEYFDEKYFNELKLKFQKRNLKISNINKEQAIILSKCNPIKNPMGTALGIEFQLNKSQVFIMPGVPSEMKAMIKEIIFPRYFKNFDEVENNITILTAGSHESYIAEKIDDLIKLYKKEIKIAFLPRYTGVNIRLSILENKNLDRLIEFKKNITKRLGKIVYGYNSDKLEEIVGKILLEKKLTISLAESCTGGYLSKKITNNPGSSKYFIGSLIAYNNSIKEKISVSKDKLDSFGAVSKEVVVAMANGIKDEFSTDIGFSISGISGPSGGSKDKDVGLVHMALAYKNKIIHRKFNFIPKRNLHREISTEVALNIIRLFLMDKDNEF